MSEPYGKELILDIWDADPRRFTRTNIQHFLATLCDRIEMQRADLHFWDYEGASAATYRKAPAHLKGTSAVQFITTSNVTIHTLDELRRVYLNVFSCKDFTANDAIEVALRYFGGHVVQVSFLERK